MARPFKLLLVLSMVLLLLGAGLAEATVQHTVRSGETLWRISQQYATTVAAISQANSISNPNLIVTGQALVIPNRHIVARGDTLFRLAQQYGTSVTAIAQANNISNPSLIYPDQLLTIPGSGGSSIPIASRGDDGGLSAADLDLFARLVYSEAAGEPYIGQVAVAASVLNRVRSPLYPNTVRGVVLHVWNGYYQYSPVLDGRINLPANESARQAARDALNGSDPSLGATGFYNPAKTNNLWVRQQPVTTVIGNHVFFR